MMQEDLMIEDFKFHFGHVKAFIEGLAFSSSLGATEKKGFLACSIFSSGFKFYWLDLRNSANEFLKV